MMARACGMVAAVSILGRNSSCTAVQLTPPKPGSQYWSRMVDQMSSKDSILSRFSPAVSGGFPEFWAQASDAHASARAMIRGLNLRFYKDTRNFVRKISPPEDGFMWR